MIKNSPRNQSSRTTRPDRDPAPINSDVAQKLDDAIENYMPIINRSAYATTGPFVRDVVRAMAPTTYDNARRMMSMVSGLTSWR